MRALIISTALATLALGACASTNIDARQVGEDDMADAASVRAGIAVRDEKAEEYINRSGARIRDDALQGFVEAQIRRVAPDFASEMRVYLVEEPVFNASMRSNGLMTVYSGLLLRAETADELAFVLGHEFGHYLERHIEERVNAASNISVGLTALSLAAGAVAVGASPATQGTTDALTLALQTTSLAAVGGFMSFNREQEREADRIGVEVAQAAGLDAAGSIRMWQNLNAEKDASSQWRVRRRSSHSRIFDTHPASDERIAALKEQVGVQDVPEAALDARREYRAQIRPHLASWLDVELIRRDPGATLTLVERLETLGEDQGVLAYARARIIRAALDDPKLMERGKQNREFLARFTRASVGDALREATAHADAPARAFRDLGDHLRAQGQSAEAAEAFRAYLRADPGAPDRALVESLIQRLQG